MRSARLLRPLGVLLLAAAFTAGSQSAAYAADGSAEGEEVAYDEGDGDACENGPRTTDWLLSLGGTIVGTAIVAGVGMQTLSRSMASGGHRQSASNIAGIGLGAFVGGAIGAIVMAAGDCGMLTAPGVIGALVSTVGLFSLLFAVATGRSR